MGWNDGASLDPLTYVQPLQQASCLEAMIDNSSEARIGCLFDSR